MPTNYNGNAANATGAQVTIQDPVDGDALNAASDTVGKNLLADWAQRFLNYFLGSTQIPTGISIAPPSFTTLTGATGWTFSGGSNFAKYWKDATGLVHLKAFGQFATGGGDPIFTAAIAVGSRPLAALPIFATRVPSGGAISSGAGVAIGGLSVDGSGQISGANFMTNGDNIWINASWQGEQ